MLLHYTNRRRCRKSLAKGLINCLLPVQCQWCYCLDSMIWMMVRFLIDNSLLFWEHSIFINSNKLKMEEIQYAPFWCCFFKPSIILYILYSVRGAPLKKSMNLMSQRGSNVYQNVKVWGRGLKKKGNLRISSVRPPSTRPLTADCVLLQTTRCVVHTANTHYTAYQH